MNWMKETPWRLVSAAAALVLSFVGLCVLLLNSHDQYGWRYNLGVAMLAMPMIYLSFLWFVAVFDRPNR